MNKRFFFKLCIAGGGAVTAGVVGVPALLTLISPAAGSSGGVVWSELGPVNQFEVGTVRKAIAPVHREDWAFSLRAKSVYVWRPKPETVVVFSRNCTDLSCPVTYDPGSACFFCPCHGGIFAQNGERLAGPPRRGLFRYANRIRNGILEIDLSSLPPMT